MRRIWEPKRDSNYYLGLALLIGASLTLVWAIWQEAFDPQDFLVYFLIYGWGYILLFKSDTEFRLNRLEEEVTKISAYFEELNKGSAPEEGYAQDESGIRSQAEPSGVGELFQELWGETMDLEEVPCNQEDNSNGVDGEEK